MFDNNYTYRRQEVLKQKAGLKSEVERIKSLLALKNDKDGCILDNDKTSYKMTPIGVISSCFKNKNGIPRQPALCSEAKATLKIDKSLFTNPEHSLIGLHEFSHIWILFVFHENGDRNSVKAKVHPPRLNGVSVGVFSTRSPHRPCAIGLSLTKLDRIVGGTLYLSGIDLLHGTPVLDIKPYIPLYDTPTVPRIISSFDNDIAKFKNDSTGYNEVNGICSNPSTSVSSAEGTKRFGNDCESSVTSLLRKPAEILEVIFTTRATIDLENFHQSRPDEVCEYCLNFIKGPAEAKKAIVEVLQNDPRSVYRKKQCLDRLYYFYIDELHVTCWFDDSIAEVLRVKPRTQSNMATTVQD